MLNEDVLAGEYARLYSVSVAEMSGDSEEKGGTLVASKVLPVNVLESGGGRMVGGEGVGTKDKGLTGGSR